MNSFYVALVLPGNGEFRNVYYLVDISQGTVVSSCSSFGDDTVAFFVENIKKDRDKIAVVMWYMQPGFWHTTYALRLLVCSQTLGEDLEEIIHFPVRETERINFYDCSIVECVRGWNRELSLL